MILKKRRPVQRDFDCLLKDDSPFLMQEDYKTLRSNISFSFPQKGSKCILITSGAPNEGKSTNAINLAVSYAQLGKKVLLIDCDLRRPTIASKLGIRWEKGLTNLLIGDCAAEEIIQYHEQKNIYVMASGPIPPDPTRLLGTSNIGDAIKELKTKFDYLIIDCSPVNIVVDALLLAPYVDGYLLLVKHEVTEHREISEMLSRLKRSSANVLGFIYTNASSTNYKYYKRYG